MVTAPAADAHGIRPHDSLFPWPSDCPGCLIAVSRSIISAATGAVSLSAVPAVFVAVSIRPVAAVGSSVTSFVPLPVLRNVDIAVPSVLYEIDGPAAGIVLMAMLAPIFRVTGRNVQVDGFFHDRAVRRPNYDGPPVDDLRRGEIADVDVAVKTGLPHTDGYAYVGGVRRNRGKDDRQGNQKVLHRTALSVMSCQS